VSYLCSTSTSRTLWLLCSTGIVVRDLAVRDFRLTAFCPLTCSCAQTLEIVKELSEFVPSLAVKADEDHLWVATAEGALRLINMEVRAADLRRKVVLTPCSSLPSVCSCVLIRSALQTFAAVKSFPAASSFRAIALHAEGLLLLSQDRQLRILSSETGAVRKCIPAPAAPEAPSLLVANEKYAVGIASAGGELLVWNLQVSSPAS
jgi:hypothetical protein